MAGQCCRYVSHRSSLFMGHLAHSVEELPPFAILLQIVFNPILVLFILFVVMQNAEHGLKRGEELAANWHLAIKQNVAALANSLADSLHNGRLVGWLVAWLVGVQGARVARNP